MGELACRPVQLYSIHSKESHGLNTRTHFPQQQRGKDTWVLNAPGDESSVCSRLHHLELVTHGRCYVTAEIIKVPYPLLVDVCLFFRHSCRLGSVIVAVAATSRQGFYYPHTLAY